MPAAQAPATARPPPPQAGARDPRTGPGADPQVFAEVMALHARLLAPMPLVQLLVVVGVSAFIWDQVPRPLLLGWGTVAVLVEALRAAYANHSTRSPRRRTPVRTQRIFIALATLAGGAMGASGPLFFPYLPTLPQALLAIIYFAMVSGGIAVAASSRRILAGYMFAMLLPANYAWVQAHPAMLAVAPGLSTLYCAFMLWIASEAEKLLTRSVAIRQERDRVVRDLERSNAEVRLAMARAEASAQARARVLAAASHDLRQPLHALSLYSAVLAEQPPADTLQEVGRNIDQIVRSLGSLLGGLLDLSRLSSGYYVSERQHFALDRLIDSVCTEFRATAQAKGLSLHQALTPLRLDGDATAVGRIMRNLLDNAIKYTEQGGIRVELTSFGDRAQLAITDSGRGIAIAEQERVFEEFYQIDNPGRDRSKGVGLGLAIVQRLCELIDAQITLESTQGVGTTFTVTLPGVITTAVAEADPERRLAPRPLDGRIIFVIDDESDILKSMTVLLRQWGVRAQAAATAAQTEALFEQFGKPDLMIADLRLGGPEHGAALAERMRRIHGDFRVLITTGETSSQALLSANKAGFALLQKPITQEVLRDAVQRLLEPAQAASGPESEDRSPASR